ncbi:sensor histidine kinase [Parafrigoribacterium soli]|uniref:sensor histidine kinase n=1 Tax=Parafrigoribacterium soli TaxID=3144663 RepID=UPI0032EADCD4
MFGRLAPWLRRPVAGFATGDLLLAAVLCAIAVASVLTGNPYEGPLYITLPVAIVSTAALAWRVRWPAMSVVLLVAAELVQTFTSQVPGSLWALVVSIIVVYSVAAHYSEGRAAIYGLVMVGTSMLEERVDNGVDYLFIVVLFGGTWLLGRASRLWRGRVNHAEQRQHDLARIAVAEERLRIARELHDVVAHSLSVISVQADAADAALARDPALAHEPLRAIHASARGSLHEIRDMLQLLRSEDDADADSTLRPTPGLAAIDELLASAERAGLTVEATIEPGAEPIPPVVDLASYRILQEALTNAAKHAGAVVVRVIVRRASDHLELEVRNGPGTSRPRIASAGVGLLGIRERVELVGGTLQTRSTPDGGWLLHAELPLDGGAR